MKQKCLFIEPFLAKTIRFSLEKIVFQANCSSDRLIFENDKKQNCLNFRFARNQILFQAFSELS